MLWSKEQSKCRISKWFRDKLLFPIWRCSGLEFYSLLFLLLRYLQSLLFWDINLIALELQELEIILVEYHRARFIKLLLQLLVLLFILYSMLVLKSSKKPKPLKLKLNTLLHVLKKMRHIMMFKILMRWFQKSRRKFKPCRQVLEKKLLEFSELFFKFFFLWALLFTLDGLLL